METIKKTFYIMMTVSMAVSLLLMGMAILGKISYNISPKIGLIDIEGTIVDNKAFRLVMEKLRELRIDPHVKALVVRVNSGGGEVAPAQELYMEFKKMRAIKPVYISIGSTAASGGYYAALGGTEIASEPGSITGSIGVIMKINNYRSITDRIGVTFSVIKSGRYKDIGSSFRDMTDDEREVLTGMISRIHDQFVSTVAEERSLDRAKVAAMADGRLFTGMEAVEEGLIDRIATQQDVIEMAAQKAGIDLEDLTVVRGQSAEGWMSKLFSSMSASLHDIIVDAVQQAMGTQILM